MKQLCQKIRSVDPSLEAQYQRRLDNLTKPRNSLGRMEEIARRYAAIRHPDLGSISRKYLFTFAADHGIAGSGVSLFPKEVTAQMVYNFLAGGAAISVLCRHYGIENIVVDVGVDHEFPPDDRLRSRKIGPGTRNFLQEPAMTPAQAEQALQVGIECAEEVVDKGAGLVGTGDMGIGNTTASSAVFAALTGLDPGTVTGLGTGIDAEQRKHKADVIRKALALHRPDPKSPLDVLSKVGGFEIGAIAGLILGCASRRVPVVVDGFISTAGALVAVELCPAVRDYLFFSHQSRETGHSLILERLGVSPLFELDLCLGEGTGAAIAMDLIAVSVKILTEMATFDDAAVSRESLPGKVEK